MLSGSLVDISTDYLSSAIFQEEGQILENVQIDQQESPENAHLRRAVSFLVSFGFENIANLILRFF